MALVEHKGDSVGLRGAREIGARKISSVSKVTIVGRCEGRIAIDSTSGKIRLSDSNAQGGDTAIGKKK